MYEYNSRIFAAVFNLDKEKLRKFACVMKTIDPVYNLHYTEKEYAKAHELRRKGIVTEKLRRKYGVPGL